MPIFKRAFLSAAICGLLMAQAPAIPDTPAGRLFAHWLEVFNRGQRDEMRRYIEESDPGADINRQMDFRRMTGGFDLKIEQSSPDEIVGVVKERDSDHIARFTLTVAADAPRTVKNFGLRLIPPTNDLPAPARMSEPAAIAALKSSHREFRRCRAPGCLDPCRPTGWGSCRAWLQSRLRPG